MSRRHKTNFVGCNSVASTVVFGSLRIYSVAFDTEASMPMQGWTAKYRRHVTLLIVFVPVITCAVAGFRWLDAFARGTPNFAVVQHELSLIQRGQAKPDAWGRVTFSGYAAYVTRGKTQKLIVLWPYNLAHDDNYFEGFLFSDTALTSSILAHAPVRGGYLNAPKSWMTLLTIDRTISNHWYHVQGEMYK